MAFPLQAPRMRAAVRRVMAGGERFLGGVLAGATARRLQVRAFADEWAAANLEARQASGPLWVVLGDSVSQGIGATTRETSYVGVMHEMLRRRDAWRVINLSKAEAGVLDVLARQLPELLAITAKEPAALVSCIIGAEDLSRRTPGLDTALRQVVSALPPGSVLGLLPHGTRAAAAFNSVIRGEAERHAMRIAILPPRLVGPLRARDGRGMGDVGHAAWARAVLAAADGPAAVAAPATDPALPVIPPPDTSAPRTDPALPVVRPLDMSSTTDPALPVVLSPEDRPAAPSGRVVEVPAAASAPAAEKSPPAVEEIVPAAAAAEGVVEDAAPEVAAVEAAAVEDTVVEDTAVEERADAERVTPGVEDGPDLDEVTEPSAVDGTQAPVDAAEAEVEAAPEEPAEPAAAVIDQVSEVDEVAEPAASDVPRPGAAVAQPEPAAELGQLQAPEPEPVVVPEPVVEVERPVAADEQEAEQSGEDRPEPLVVGARPAAYPAGEAGLTGISWPKPVAEPERPADRDPGTAAADES